MERRTSVKTPKKPSWWDEFVAFAIKGNAMALAVGTIIGAAFSTITKSITDDIIMPIVAIFMGGIQKAFPDIIPKKGGQCSFYLQSPINQGFRNKKTGRI